jgi:cytochrome c peroxidase
MSIRSTWVVAAALTALFLGGVGWVYLDWHDSSEISANTVTQDQTSPAADIFTPLPLVLSLDSRKVELGSKLFTDPKLSGDGSISCASCHNLDTGGVDRKPRSRGVGGMEGGINAPTVFNSGFNFRQFWDGRAETLEDQIDGPLQNPIEMAGTWPKALAAIAEDPQYVAAFKAIYHDGIQPHNVKDAIATFERSLVTPNSRFDRFLRGDQTALSEKEQAGYGLFKQIGCTSCHQGLNIGGNMYQKLGIMEDYFAVRGHITEVDLGRFNITKREQDRYFFKVPTLRNVALTPPYLHDGSAATLEDVVQVMARYQLGKKLKTAEVAKIAAFLRTLSGEYSGKPLE